MKCRSARHNRRKSFSKSRQRHSTSIYSFGQRRLGLEVLEDRRLLSVSDPTIELFDASPALFVENQGQWADASVRYALHGSGANVLHTTGGPVFQLFEYRPAEETDETSDPIEPLDPLAEPEEIVTQYAELFVSFDGANIVEPVGMDQAEVVQNFFIGDEANWRVGVPSYETVGYSGLYDGIDLLTWGRPDSLKYEFRVAPGSDYTQIEITYYGITGLQLDANGALHVQTSLGELIDDGPRIYQEIDGEQVEVTGAFHVIDADTYSFRITGDYDSSAELTIDPEVDWSTYVGGDNDDRAHDIVVDASGNAFVAGKVRSADLSGAINAPAGGGGDAFVAKLAPNGNLEWSTYLGGSSYEQANGITLDGTGNVVVCGWTVSTDLPAATNVRNGSREDAFAGKLTDNGHLLWTAYLGGTHQDAAHGVAADSEGDVLVGGRTQSLNFDCKINEPFGANDGFLAKLTAQGTVEWARYLGGPGEDSVYGVAIRGETDVLVAGLAREDLEGANNNYKGGSVDAFVARISAADGSQTWATYLGGTHDDSAYGIVVDSYGDALIVGNTRSADLEGASNDHHGGHGTPDAFVAKVSANGVQTWATFVGGRYHDEGHGIAIDPNGNAMVTGITGSYDFEGVVHPSFGMGTYVAKILPDGSVDQAVLFGGSRTDDGYGIAVDQSGNVLITGYTDSEYLEAANNEYYGGGDAFVAKISGLCEPATDTLSGTKFEDLNNNGARDAGEPGLEGWTIQLEQFASELLTTFDNPEAATGDYFGVRLAQYGDDILVSAPDDDSIGGTNTGAVYRFSKSGEQQPFPLPELQPGDHFGYSLATNGDKVLVGAYDDREAVDSGAVWLFDGSIWQRIANPAASRGDYFGSAVGWMGNDILVGAGYDNGHTGSIYLFDSDSLEPLPLPGPSLPAGSEFGISLAVHGHKIVVGARWDSTEDVYGGGAVWLFDDSVADPQLKWRKIPNPDPHSYDFFGYGIAWLDEKFVVGCHRGPTWHSAAPGSVYVFDASGNLLHSIDGSAPGDGFGYAVSAVGNNILVGAGADDTAGTDAGIAYLYDGSTYEKLLTIPNPNPASRDEFGNSVAGVGNDVLIAARQPDVGPGVAYLFSTTELVAAQTTIADGSYEFGGVTPGEYRVSEVLQDGWTQTFPPDGTYTITVGTDDITGLDFGNWINYPPAANDDSGGEYSTDEDTVLTLEAPGVLGNDTDANGDLLTALPVFDPVPITPPWSITTVQGGEALLDPDGSFTYTPPINFNGTDSFQYLATDGMEPSEAATVHITLNPVNDAPVLEGIPDVFFDEDSSDSSIDLDDYYSDVETPAVGAEFLVVSSLTGVTATIDPTSHVLTIVGDGDFNGRGEITIEVTDTGDGPSVPLSDTDAFYVTVRNLVDLSGRVFDDLNNDGLFDPDGLDNVPDNDDDETGISGVTVEVWNQGMTVCYGFATTIDDGTYLVDSDLKEGTYKIVEVLDESTLDLLDGKETAGTLGGVVNNVEDSNEIFNILIGVPGTMEDGAGYLFAEIQPSEISGMVWLDFNNDGEVNFREKVPETDVLIKLDGQDDRNVEVHKEFLVTEDEHGDRDGTYMFHNLRPGDYTITEDQPADLVDGKDALGTVNGLTIGDADPDDPRLSRYNDLFSVVVLPRPDSVGENYNFGERPPSGGDVTPGQTATIGFWQNKNGQALINALPVVENEDGSITSVGNWLAASFSNMYGVNAGHNDLTGQSNAYVADFYSDLFRRKKKEAIELGLGGPTKMDAQVMAVAFATYVTNETLAGTVAADYGFLVTECGVGICEFDVGESGQAFGVDNGTKLAVLDLLFATTDMAVGGVLYDRDGDGDADDDLETLLRTLANDVYSAINEQGDT